MSFQQISHVRIVGLAAAVPSEIIENRDSGFFPDEAAYQAFVDNVGIERRRVLAPGMTCSDLCEKAAEKLLLDLGWDKSTVDLLVFVSQNPDYVLPATSCVVQGRMGLTQDTLCLDISSGCSGWVLGLATASSLLEKGTMKRALLLVGDANPNLATSKDRSHGPLFSSCGTVTAVEYAVDSPQMTFIHHTDGTGYEAIIRRHGGARHPFTAASLELMTDDSGITRRGIDTEMDGTAVYVFGITRVPRAVKELLTCCDSVVGDVDYFVFHQANMMMNEKIRKKCNIPIEKCPYSLKDFGNNSSGSIAITLVTQLADILPGRQASVVACGFGVGLSWSTAHLVLDHVTVSSLIEI